MKHHEASNRGSRFVPLVMAAVQLAAWVWVPVIHASTDVLSTTQHVENSHSNDCSKIHVETWCHTCGATFDLPDDGGAHTIFGGLHIQRAGRHANQHKVGSTILPQGNPVRAPPTAQR